MEEWKECSCHVEKERNQARRSDVGMKLAKESGRVPFSVEWSWTEMRCRHLFRQNPSWHQRELSEGKPAVSTIIWRSNTKQEY